MTIEEAIEAAKSSGRFVIAVMHAEADAINVTQEHTDGVNLAIGCAVLVKATLGKLDTAAERKFLEEFIRELRS